MVIDQKKLRKHKDSVVFWMVSWNRKGILLKYE